jgi:hypothetical protein
LVSTTLRQRVRRQAMPLFRKRSQSPETPPQRNTFFGKSPSPSSDSKPRSNSFFRRGRQSSSDSDTPHSTLHRRIGRTSEPTILAARQKVTDAEGAEKEADKALHSARMAVKEARKHVRNLEREAAEE